MEKKMENNALPEEALDEVTGGVIDPEQAAGLGSYARITQRNLDVAHNLIIDDMTAPDLGAQAKLAKHKLVQEVQQNIF